MQIVKAVIDHLLQKHGKPDFANELYEYFCKKCMEEGIEVQKGIFGAKMEVSLINDGPVTIILEK